MIHVIDSTVILTWETCVIYKNATKDNYCALF